MSLKDRFSISNTRNLSYNKRDPSLTYTLESYINLTNLSGSIRADQVFDDEAPIGGNFKAVTSRIPVSIGKTNKFFRLRITQ